MQVIEKIMRTFATDLPKSKKIMTRQKRFILQESEIPTKWYNIQAEMPNKPLPPIHPGR